MERITAEERVRSAACLCTQVLKDCSDILDAGPCAARLISGDTNQWMHPASVLPITTDWAMELGEELQNLHL